MSKVTELLGLQHNEFFIQFSVPSIVLVQTFKHLTAFFKGRDTEKIFELISVNGTVCVRATTVLTYSAMIATGLNIDDFSVICSYQDLSSLLASNSDVSVSVTPLKVSFYTDSISTSLSVKNAMLSHMLVDIPNYKSLNISHTVVGFTKLAKLTNLYKDFPQNKSIYCRDGWSYVITPTAYAYYRGCSFETVIDTDTATLISSIYNTCQANWEKMQKAFDPEDFEDDEEESEGSHTMPVYFAQVDTVVYLAIDNIELFIPASMTIPERRVNNLLKESYKIADITASSLYKELNRIKTKCKVQMSFRDNTLAINIENPDFTFTCNLPVNTVKNAYVQTDCSYLLSLLTIFDDDAIEVRGGDCVLILKSKKAMAFLSCLN